MQVERVRFHAVQLAVAALLGLPLIEVRLSTRLAIELLNLIRVHIEQIAVVGLLVARRKSAKDNHMVL